MKNLLEDVFVTEGVPNYTFVQPPNYNQILIDVRKKGKPVIVEGQSGTGKTTTAKKIINQLNENGVSVIYLSARKPEDIHKIIEIYTKKDIGYYIIDDFHRLDNAIQYEIAELIKLSAETQDDNLPKIIIVGINMVGASLINLVPDIAKRCGIHRIQQGTKDQIFKLIESGCEKLNISISEKELIFSESNGDYWLAQSICQTICSQNNILEEQDDFKSITFELENTRKQITENLSHTYNESVKEFCRGRRFRPSNDPYFKLLKLISTQSKSIVDLNELANAHTEFKGSINNVKEKRLKILLDSKESCNKYFYYNQETKNFAIEDPALFFYLKNLEWEKLRSDCGFRESADDEKEFDLAISFAGQNRQLAKFISEKFEELDVKVFYDELYEANYLGKAWSKMFEEIFIEKSRFVVCLLDNHHRDKIWPTFERECFIKRVPNGDVIPVFLDDTIFVGIPSDIVGIKFDKSLLKKESWTKEAEDSIIFKIWEKLE